MSPDVPAGAAEVGLFAEKPFGQTRLADHRGEGCGLYLILHPMSRDIDEVHDPVYLQPIAGVTGRAMTYAHEAVGNDDFDKLFESAD